MKDLAITLLMLTAFAATSKSNDHDPYIWLEELEGREALAWVEASNTLALLHPYLRCCRQGLTIFFVCKMPVKKKCCNFIFEIINKKQYTMKAFTKLLLLILIASFSGCQTVSEPKEKPVITVEEVLNAQQQWCDALIEIGEVYAAGGDYHHVTESIITRLYDYDNGQVIFKPTLAYGDQTFRLSKQGAVAYFAGGDPDFPNDKGFALRPWVAAEFQNIGNSHDGIHLYGDMAIGAGHVHFTGADGGQVTVEKIFGYRKYDDGSVRIILHNSSLPYSP